MIAPVARFQILTRALSGTLVAPIFPSIALKRKPKLPALSIVPSPLSPTVAPLIVNHDKCVATKFLPGKLTIAVPIGLAPPAYLAFISKCSLPAKAGLAGYDPSGALNQPSAFIEPAFASKTTTGENV